MLTGAYPYPFSKERDPIDVILERGHRAHPQAGQNASQKSVRRLGPRPRKESKGSLPDGCSDAHSHGPCPALNTDVQTRNSMPPTFYKYKAPTPFEYIADILINERLYCAPYDQLNDPFEGIFLESIQMGDRRFLARLGPRISSTQRMHLKRVFAAFRPMAPARCCGRFTLSA